MVYLVLTREDRQREVWRRFRFLPGVALFLAIAAPWHILATLRNPPYFDFTMHSESGSYHGFFWFYFINEQLLRFLNRRYPRDYNTVPRALFWLFHLLWLFPWSVYFGSLFKLQFKGEDRAAATRLLALCWAGLVLCFFTFSTTQEYYSMPAYPAMALLLASAMTMQQDRWLEPATRVAAAIAAVSAVVIGFLLWNVRSLPAPGDISVALTSNPDVYTLSLGHMADLTFSAFAYLRLPLAMACGGNPGGSHRRMVPAVPSCGVGAGADDGDVLPGRASRPGGLRSLPEHPALGGGAQSRAAWTVDRGRSVLHVFFRILLQQPDGAPAEWACEQPGVWVLSSGSAAGVHQGRGPPGSVGEFETLLSGGGESAASAIQEAGRGGPVARSGSGGGKDPVRESLDHICT